MSSHKCKSTPKQIDILTQHMIDNSDLIFGRDVHNRKVQLEGLWLRLTVELNLYGPPVRKLMEWHSIWRAYLGNLKKKVQKYNLNKRNLYKSPYFTAKEKKLISLLEFRDRLLTDISKKQNSSPALSDSRVTRTETENSLESTCKLKHCKTNAETDSTVRDVDDTTLGNAPFCNVTIGPHENSLPSDEMLLPSTLPSSLQDNTLPSVSVKRKESDTQQVGSDNNSMPRPRTDSLRVVPIEKLSYSVPQTSPKNEVAKDPRHNEISQQILQQLKILNSTLRDSRELRNQSLKLEQEKLELMKSRDSEEIKQAYINIELKRKELEIYELKVRGLCSQCVVKQDTE